MLGKRLILRGKLAKRAAQLAQATAHPLALAGFLQAMRAARRRGTADDALLGHVKYLGEYLAVGLTAEQRRRAILSHHRFLAGRLPPGWQPGERELWRLRADDHAFAIVLRAAALAPMEGEHELAFLMDGEALCTLTFLFTAGAAIGVDARRAMAIGGVQGAPFARERNRAAAKANGEIAPAAALMLAARALAGVFATDGVFGLGSARHPAHDYAADRLMLDYDRFWRDAGVAGCSNGWVALLPWPEERPLADVPLAHRARTRRKRERRRVLHAAIVARLRAELGEPMPRVTPAPATSPLLHRHAA